MVQPELRENTNLLDNYFPFNIFFNTPKGNNVLKLHWHNNIEIILMVSGHAVFNIGSEEIEARPGDILFVNCGQLHSGYSVDNTEVVFNAIVFNGALLASQSPDPYHSKYISPFLESKLHYPYKISHDQEEYCIFEPLVENIIKEFVEKKPGFQLTIKSYLVLLTVGARRNCCTDAAIETNDEFYRLNIERIKVVIKYVENHFAERIALKEVAKMINLSPYHFCKTFKKLTGRTFIDFLNLYRVNEAEELLRNTTLTITEIADKIGFCNINYFDRIFKKYKRYSPSKCRR